MRRSKLKDLRERDAEKGDSLGESLNKKREGWR